MSIISPAIFSHLNDDSSSWKFGGCMFIEIRIQDLKRVVFVLTTPKITCRMVYVPEYSAHVSKTRIFTANDMMLRRTTKES